MFGFSSVTAALSAGLIAIGTDFISAKGDVKGVNALCNAVLACCGATLDLISGPVWIRSFGQENRRT